MEEKQNKHLKDTQMICGVVPKHAKTSPHLKLTYQDKMKLHDDHGVTMDTLNQFLKDYGQYEELWKNLRKWQ
eukprot:UN32223